MLADRYRLDVPLGRGAMGEVWRAWDTRLGRPVAVKMLAGSASAAADAVARFRHEARTAARLSNPHAVGVYDVGTADGRCFLVMELVSGRSLAEELREDGPLSFARVAEIAAQTAEGLAAAHARGVVHRDIKPSNLLVGEDGSVKIADFGIARGDDGETTAAATLPGAVLGTCQYLSPEAAMGGTAEGPADIYGLGCSLYELLTGRPPFTGEHPVAVLRQHVEDAPVPPRHRRPRTPRALDAYVLRMLAKQPGLRPTADEVAAWFTGGDWQGEPMASEGTTGATRTLTDLAPAPAPASGGPATTPARTRRRRAPAAGAVTAAAAIAAATFLFTSPIADGDSPSATSPQTSSRTTTTPHHAAPAPAAAPGRRGAVQAQRHSSARPSAHTTATPSATAPSAPPTHRSAPASASPPPTPHTSAPAPTPSGTSAGPTTHPTPTAPPPTSPDATPPGDGQ
ncbi:serine/threonine-protein kinase [Streptomyces sp. NPDC051976]|uniref:serine/threonine-protein kinase n=1 Tax=Streptomyces sp. NPDC051976 TaxID=3154947 RepID=UPI0034435A8F